MFLASVYALIYRAVLRDRVYHHVVSYTAFFEDSSYTRPMDGSGPWGLLRGIWESVHTMEICGGLNYHHQGRLQKSPKV